MATCSGQTADAAQRTALNIYVSFGSLGAAYTYDQEEQTGSIGITATDSGGTTLSTGTVYVTGYSAYQVKLSSTLFGSAAYFSLPNGFRSLGATYSYDSQEETGTLTVSAKNSSSSNISSKQIYITQSATNQVKISSTILSSDVYFNLTGGGSGTPTNLGIYDTNSNLVTSKTISSAIDLWAGYKINNEWVWGSQVTLTPQSYPSRTLRCTSIEPTYPGSTSNYYYFRLEGNYSGTFSTNTNYTFYRTSW